MINREAVEDLVQRIRRGTKVEYTWPVFENLLATLTAQDKISSLSFAACFPHVAIAHGSTLHLLCGRTHRTVEIPDALYISRIAITDDDVFILYFDENSWSYHTFWVSERTQHPVNFDDSYRDFSDSYEGEYAHTVDGIPYLGSTPLKKENAARQLFFGENLGVMPCYAEDWDYDISLITRLPDGPTMSNAEFQSQLRSGSIPGFDIPQSFLDALPGDAELSFAASYVAEATEDTCSSPLGLDSHRHYAFTFWSQKSHQSFVCLSPLGAYTLKRGYNIYLPNIMKKPGAQDETFENRVWLTQGTSLHDFTSRTPITPSLTAAGTKHFLEYLPAAGLHYLTVRNETVSQRMRQCSVEQAETMMKNPLHILDFAEGDETLAAAIAGMISEIGQNESTTITLPKLETIPDFLRHLYASLTEDEVAPEFIDEIPHVPEPPLPSEPSLEIFHILIAKNILRPLSPDLLKQLIVALRHPQASGRIDFKTWAVEYILAAMGREKLLLSWLALPCVPLKVVREYHAFFQWCVEVGLLGTWHRITVSTHKMPAEGTLWWENHTLRLRYFTEEVRFWNPHYGPRPIIDSIDPFDEDYFMPQENFLMALDRILTWHESRHRQKTNIMLGWDEKTVAEAAEEAAQVSTIPARVWHYLFSGDALRPSAYRIEDYYRKFQSNPHQPLGFSDHDVESFRELLLESFNGQAGLFLTHSWHEDFLRTGPNIDAIRSTWQTLWGTPWIHLTDTMFTHLRPTLEKLPHNLWNHFHQTHPNPTAVDEENSHLLFNLYTHLTHLVTPSSPTALTLAKRLEQFSTYDK